ncbi:Animal haem peroxidase superfamily [Verrucomicrobiia bacterium DG1235]|nr:Animal haem peroxidase superfamily [Verrucomicrobiae bacterium DG1235]
MVQSAFAGSGHVWNPDCGEEEYRFGYLFPRLTSLDVPDGVLKEIGKPSNDSNLPAYLEDSQFRGTDNNSETVVGQTYIGQILAHDISVDRYSVLGQSNNAWELPNDATPWLDLDTLYEFDGIQAPRETFDRAKLLLGNYLGNERDFPRTLSGHAILADRRNDENNNVAQLSGVLMRLHNVFVDQLRSEGVPSDELFDKARQWVEWHWQSIVLTEFLPNVLDAEVLDDVMQNGRRHYRNYYSKRGIVPVEFSAAASRFGHSMVRGRYTLNEDFDRVRVFPLSEAELGRNLLGNQAIAPERQIEWNRFFRIAGSASGDTDDDVDQFAGLQVARKIDRLLARPMLRLPVGGPGLPDFILDPENTIAGMPTVSLGALSLFRGKALGLPSGQDVAAAMGYEPLDISVFNFCGLGEDCGPDGINLAEPPEEAPLFLYVVQEAREQNEGERLGNVGSRIVAEVVIGLLEGDRSSIAHVDFQSTITGTGLVSMADVIEFIGWAE